MSDLKDLITEFYNYLGKTSSNILKPNLNNTEHLRQNLNDQLTILDRPLNESLYKKIDRLLMKELSQKHIINVNQLPKKYSKFIIYKGDITLLQVDVIINPANSKGLGCFQLGHKCLDNIIHACSGPRLRDECRRILNGNEISTSKCIITQSYNLPSKYIIHTVGPIAKNNQKLEFDKLAQTYINCLEMAKKYNCRTIAFPCISTGVFGYPRGESAQIALRTVMNWLKNENMFCIFCTFLPEDYKIYNEILN